MNYYVGLDLSFSGTGLIVLDEENIIVKQFLISTKKDEKNIHDIETRMIHIRNNIENCLREFEDNIKFVYIEDISFGSMGSGADQLAALNYYIRVFLLQKSIPFKTFPPTTIKKFVTGNGQCKKNLMLKEVYKRWKIDFSDDNLCDAYSLAKMSRDGFEIIQKNKKSKNGV